MEGDLPQDEQVQVDELSQSQEELDQQEAAFSESFGEEVPGDTAAENTEQQDQAAQEEQDEQQQQEMQQVQAEVAEALEEAGYTPAQVKEILDSNKQSFEKVYGKFGEYQREILALKTAVQEIKAGGGSGQKVRFTKDSLKRLNEEYPEFAELMAEDLSEALGAGTGQSLDLDSVRPILESLTKEGLQNTVQGLSEHIDLRVNQGILTALHPDWANVRNEEDFKQWVGKLPPDQGKSLNETHDPRVVSEYLTRFKSERAESQKLQQQRGNRLASAVTPTRGSAKEIKPGAQTEEDGFNASFA